MTTVFLRPEGEFTIPEKIRVAARLEEGEPLEVEIVEEGILLRRRPKDEQDPSQWWFWTPEWQAGEREADADYAAGRSTVHETGEEFLAALRRERSDSADV